MPPLHRPLHALRRAMARARGRAARALAGEPDGTPNGANRAKSPDAEAPLAESPEVQALQARLREYELGWPPGHFYSPIPSLSEVSRREAELFADATSAPGVELDEAAQLALFDRLTPYYGEQPWQDAPAPPLRYGLDNPNYPYGDALTLYAMLRHLRPRRVIEIGSGHSSLVTLDTVERFLGGSVECTFIEPYAALLRSGMRPGDAERVTVLERPLQEVPPEVFDALGDGDVMFVDSTHVSKIGSDVNHIFFTLLPRLASGVYVHFHDIYWPFEYPREWIYQGRAWNEAYLLRAFLQYNAAFEIVLCSSWLQRHHAARLSGVPLWGRTPMSNFWLRRR